MAMHDPVRFSLIVRGLINVQQHEGPSFLRTPDTLIELTDVWNMNNHRMAPRVSRRD